MGLSDAHETALGPMLLQPLSVALLRPRPIAPRRAVAQACTRLEFLNPLEIDGFRERGGWGAHTAPAGLPLLVFLPGMDGSLFTPFMQYPELGVHFELACMRHVDGLASRATFAQLADECADYVSSGTYRLTAYRLT